MSDGGRASRRLVLVVALAPAVLGLGCGDEGDDGGAASPAAGSAPELVVTIERFEFRPARLEARRGARVIVRNEDDAPHTLTANDGTFDTGNLEGGRSGSVTLTRSGEVPYRCEIHDYMRGVVVVT